MNKTQQTTKKARGFKRIFQLEGEPRYIASGFALGSFIGMMPIPGFQVLVSLLIASITKVHKTAAVIGVFNTNLATGALFFAFNYWLGKQLLGINPDFILPSSIDIHFFSTLLSAGKEVFLSMLVGGLITGIVFSLLAYKLSLHFLSKRGKS